MLPAIERDLRRQYGNRYRVMAADSGSAAVAALQQLKLRNDAIAHVGWRGQGAFAPRMRPGQGRAECLMVGNGLRSRKRSRVTRIQESGGEGHKGDLFVGSVNS